MPEDIFGMMQQAGRSIGSAFSRPAEMRYKLAEAKYKRDKEEDKEEKEKELQAQRRAAGASYGERFGPEVAEMFRAGMKPSEIATLVKAETGQQKLKLSALKAKKGAGKRGYGDPGNIGDTILSQQMKMLDQAHQSLTDARGSGDEATILESKQAYSAAYDSAKNLGQKVNDFSGKVKNAALLTQMTHGEDLLSRYHPDQVEALDVATREYFKKDKDSAVSSYLDEMEQMTDVLGLGIDLSGIPSQKDFHNYVIVESARGKINTKIVDQLYKASDKALRAITGDRSGETNETTRNVAGTLLKQRRAYSAVMKEGERQLGKAKKIFDDPLGTLADITD